jgi:hypothetical protein
LAGAALHSRPRDAVARGDLGVRVNVRIFQQFLPQLHAHKRELY